MAAEELEASDELSGFLVRLRAPSLGDLAALEAFDRDTDGARNWDQTHLPRSHEQARTWLEELLTKPADGDKRFLVVEATRERVVAGSVSVSSASSRHGRFSFGIGLGSAHRRKGYGTEAVRLLLRFYFAELRYQKCDTGIYAYNEASLRMHEKLGFQVEGRIRRAVFTNGAFHDEILVGITAEEFLRPS